jgi:hypothetical protein
MWPLAISDYCASHPNAAQCQINSTSNDIVAFIIVGVIAAIVVFDIVWKLRFGTRGPAMRLLSSLGQGLSGHRSRSSRR